MQIMETTVTKSKITTSFIYPPIPIRNFDWEAYRDDCDEDGPIGYGSTEEEAIKNLKKEEYDEFGWHEEEMKAKYPEIVLID